MDKGELAETDEFICHGSISEKCALIVTDRQLVIAKVSTLDSPESESSSVFPFVEDGHDGHVDC